jgi:hypothetical protein
VGEGDFEFDRAGFFVEVFLRVSKSVSIVDRGVVRGWAGHIRSSTCCPRAPSWAAS